MRSQLTAVLIAAQTALRQAKRNIGYAEADRILSPLVDVLSAAYDEADKFDRRMSDGQGKITDDQWNRMCCNAIERLRSIFGFGFGYGHQPSDMVRLIQARNQFFERYDRLFIGDHFLQEILKPIIADDTTRADAIRAIQNWQYEGPK